MSELLRDPSPTRSIHEVIEPTDRDHRDPAIMSGEPILRGTRILAETILNYLRAGTPAEEIFRDYPSLPVDGIDAVARWAEEAYGADWKSMPERSASPEEDRFAKEFKDARSKLDPNHKLGF
jgi:uncharacterized protein (DUF433 family)